MSESNHATMVDQRHDAEVVESFLDGVLADGPERVLPPELIQKLFTVAVQQYSRRYENTPAFAPMLGQYVNATDVSTSCIEMLRVVDLELFELTFWGGRLQDTPEYENR